MSILLGASNRILIQGLGRDGSFQAQRMLDYGSKITAAVHPKRRGKFEDVVPYFESVQEAVNETGADTGVIFVPAPAAPDAIVEQADAGVRLIVCITEGIPVQDMVKVKAYLKGSGSLLVGPNCPGIITPKANAKAGIIPQEIVKPGRMGVVSRSGTLTYEAISQLVHLGIGQSTCVGIGGDPIHGLSFTDVLGLFEMDDETDAVVLIGEIGGEREQEAAAFIKEKMTKPVAAAIAGRTAPSGKRMGHAGAVITGRAGLASEKMKALEDAGAFVAESPISIGKTAALALNRG